MKGPSFAVQRILQHRGVLAAVAWSPDARYVAAGGDNGSVSLWDAGAGTRLSACSEHAGLVEALAWSPDGELLASAGMDGIVRIWRTPSLTIETVMRGHRDLVRTLAWSPDGTSLASGSDDRTVRLWRRSGEHYLTLGGPAMSDAERLVRLRREAAGRTNVIPFHGTPAGPNSGHTDYVTSLAWSKDGALLASGGYDCCVRVWRPAHTVIEERILQVENYVFALDWPDVPRLLTIAEGQVVLLFCPENDRVVHAFKTIGHVTSVRWEPHGAYLATACPDATAIQLWQREPADPVTLTGHVEGVRDLAWSPDGSALASAGKDGTVRLWKGQP